MKQLTQKLRDGDMLIQEVPVPQLDAGMVMVRNHFSLISAGTEGSTVKAARKSLLGKAKERPQQVKQVLEVLKTQGPIQTYRAVMKKLDAYSPLGYSSAGVVIEVADDVTGFKVGDKVACAGAGYANHAEVITVPQNLCVKLAADADLSLACYNTLGAIALQGVRQADMRLGETCAVIGLGLIGHLVCLLLKSSGVNVIGIDVSQEAVNLASQHCVDLGLTRSAAGIENTILQFTSGIGVDCVIIAAATSSLDPVNFAGAICRRKGKVVVLGAVPTGFDRDPFYYKKELELKMSCSYGPGRYDLNYEEKGIDYPVDYVRWTEKRNMEAFQHLIHTRAIDLSYLTTHRFHFDDACKAYDLVVNHTDPYKGIVLEYDVDRAIEKDASICVRESNANSVDTPAVAFIGAGSYAQGNLLPNLPDDIRRVGVMTNSGTTAKRVSEKFGFEFCTSSADDIFQNNDINTVFIATRHDSHARYVKEAIKVHKHVYVEKPLCLSLEQLLEIKDLLDTAGDVSLMVGFNRRFSPLSTWVKKQLPQGPKSMIYRVNAGAIPKAHWIQDASIGGGRIIGEACHFIDLMAWMCDSCPVKVTASALDDKQNLNDTVNIMIDFADGSKGVLAYYANGSKALSKEYFEVFAGGATAVIDDYRKALFYGKRESHMKLSVQNKGQKEMMKQYFDALKNKMQLITMHQLFTVTLATFGAIKSLQNDGMPVRISSLQTL